MKTYEVTITDKSGAIVLFKKIQADTENEAEIILLENVEIYKDDFINIKEGE